MNYQTTTIAADAYESRKLDRQRRDRAHLDRAITALTIWRESIPGDRPHTIRSQRLEEQAELGAMDALRFVMDSSPAVRMADLFHELGMDNEGYPLDANGYPVSGAERVYVPLSELGV